MGSFWIESPTYGRHEVLYDDEDWELISQYTWTLFKIELAGNRRTFYAYSFDRSCNPKKRITMHRLVMGFPKNKKVDHIHHNTLDNRKENLRLANSVESTRNRRSCGDVTSKYKGVSWNKKRNQWTVWIKPEDHSVFLGYFDDEVEAARQYDYYAIQYFKEYAFLNFPDYNYSDYIPKEVSRIKRTSKHTGVHWDTSRQKWTAAATVNYRKIMIGRYSTESEAAIAYNKYIINNNLDRKLNEVV